MQKDYYGMTDSITIFHGSNVVVEKPQIVLSFGENIEVISLANFRDRIAEKIQATNQLYSKDKNE